MIGALIISQIVLGVLVLALAVVCFALARQIGVLYERIAPAGALAINQRLKTGDAAPSLALTSIDGRAVAVGANRPRTSYRRHRTISTNQSALGGRRLHHR